MKNSNLPEEKLLRLIRGEKKERVQAAPASKPAEVRTPGRRRNGFVPDLTLARVISLVILAASCLFLLRSIVASPVQLPEDSPAQAAVSDGEAGVKPLDVYLTATQTPLFGASKTESVEQAAAEVTDAEVAEMLRDLTLLGVVSGANPQAIIEDKRSQKTYYVTAGQTIGNLTVESVTDTKVTLGYRGKRSELFF